MKYVITASISPLYTAS